jgi:hypothetical protein
MCAFHIATRLWLALQARTAWADMTRTLERALADSVCDSDATTQSCATVMSVVHYCTVSHDELWHDRKHLAPLKLPTPSSIQR